VRQKDVLKCIITVSGGQCVMTDSRILMRESFAACWVSGTFLIAVCVFCFKYEASDVTFTSFIQSPVVHSVGNVLTYRCLHRLAPRYLSDYIQSVVDSNRRLSLVVVILAASHPMYTAVHCWRSCVSGSRKRPLEQSAIRRHLSINADCLSKPPKNLFFRIIFFLTVFAF